MAGEGLLAAIGERERITDYFAIVFVSCTEDTEKWFAGTQQKYIGSRKKEYDTQTTQDILSIKRLFHSYPTHSRRTGFAKPQQSPG